MDNLLFHLPVVVIMGSDALSAKLTHATAHPLLHYSFTHLLCDGMGKLAMYTQFLLSLWLSFF